MMQRDENGRLIVRRRPGRRNRIEAETPSSAPEESTEVVRAGDVGPGSGTGVESVGSHGHAADESRSIDAAASYDVRGPLEPWMCQSWLRGHVGELKCRRPKLAGAKRCALHGSKTMRSQIAAERTIMLAANPAAAKLMSILEDPNAPYNAVVTAARDLLDRADLTGKNKPEPAAEPTLFEQAVMRATRVVRTIKVRVNEDGTETVIEAEERNDGTAVVRPGPARVRRGVGHIRPGGQPRVIEGSTAEPTEPEWHDKLAAKAPLSEPVDYSERVGSDDDGTPIPLIEPPTPPREQWVNSSDTPPKHSQAKLGYNPSSGRGGTRRTGSVMRDG